MSGAIPLLPLYAFTAWTRTLLTLPFTEHKQAYGLSSAATPQDSMTHANTLKYTLESKGLQPCSSYPQHPLKNIQIIYRI
jgi:hypothetical protein